jgi:RNA polymerase sigma-70 factor (ECF subfamily)
MPELDDFLANDYDRVVRSVALACGSVDAAEDAVQVALVEALENDRRGRQIENLAAWVFVVATNSTRRRFRRAQTERRSLERLASVRAEHAPTIDERSFELWPAVVELPRRQRQAVVLFYLHDLDVRTIADLLEVSEGTIKTALHRGRATLEAILGAPAASTTTTDKEDDHVR